MNKTLLCTAFLGGAVAVIAGAFGAHALKDTLGAYEMGIYQTAVQYLMWHSIAAILVLVVGGGVSSGGNPWATWAALGFMVGSLIFSGSLFALAFTGVKLWGAVTPIGGLLFILSWFCGAWVCWTRAS